MPFLFLVLALAGGVGAQTDQSQTPETVESVEARIASLQGAEGVSDSVKAAAGELLNQALAALNRRAQLVGRAEQFRREAAEAPALLERIRQELARPAEEVSPAPPADATLAQLEQLQAEAEAELRAARAQVEELQAESTRRQGRRSEIPNLLAQARQRLSELSPPVEGNGADVQPWIIEARRVLHSAQRRVLQAEIEALEAEVANYDARRDLLPARRDMAARRVATGEKRYTAWQNIVSNQRQKEAAQAAREAERLRRQAARQHPVLQEFAAESQRLAAERASPDGIPQRINSSVRKITETRSSLLQLRRDYASVRSRIDASGMNKATGLLLRRQFESLPDTHALKRLARATQRELEETEFTLIELQDERAAIGDVDGMSRRLLEAINTDASSQTRQDLEAVAIELVTARRDLLDQLVTDASSYRERLEDLDEVARLYLASSEAYAAYIGERILWIRSIAAGRLPALKEIRTSVSSLTDGGTWADSLRRVWDDAKRRKTINGLALVFVAGLFIMAPWAKRRLLRSAGLVSKFRTDAFMHSARAVFDTLLLTLPLPALVWWLGWMLQSPVDQNTLAASTGSGFQISALVMLSLRLLQETVRRDGLGEAHFKWQKIMTRGLRVHLLWFIPTVVSMLFVSITLDVYGDETANSIIGRGAFTVAVIAFALFGYRETRLAARLAEASQAAGMASNWLTKLRPSWAPLVVNIPLVLAVLAWSGFYYSALQLGTGLFKTLVLVLVLIVLHALLMRWLFIARRRLAVEDARRRRDQAINETKIAGQNSPPTDSTPPPVDEDKVNLPGISQQSQQLFRMATGIIVLLGLITIWGNVLPALRMLDRVQIWPEVRILNISDESAIPILEASGFGGVSPEPGQAPTENDRPVSPPSDAAASPPLGSPGGLPMPSTTIGGSATGESETLRVTLVDLTMTVLILLATLIAIRNLPGLIEMILLQRLPLDASSRYALSTVIRYSIAIMGISIGLGTIGITWSSIQWLAAALTFGLAFGLQEIFANFISGLIILAERPIRIGDTVTVGTTSGTVTRIKMRATTITDFDRKELIIPNKSFITGDVINWTLSDPILRIVIPVGVSYGADVEKAEAILLDVAQKHPLVLTDPKPSVFFKNFGDSTLNFDLRVFIPSIDHFVSVRHSLHMQITKAFREAGVEIAFPQRDLHIRSAEGLSEMLRQATSMQRSESGGTSS